MESTVQCPYCFESVEIYIESDVYGQMVQDCEVCCNPWLLHVRRNGQEMEVDVERAQ